MNIKEFEKALNDNLMIVNSYGEIPKWQQAHLNDESYLLTKKYLCNLAKCKGMTPNKMIEQLEYAKDFIIRQAMNQLNL